MNKKILFLAFTAFIYSSAISQVVNSNSNDCIQKFTIEAKIATGNNQRVNDIIISWDFNKTPNTDHLELSFQVQPLNACWKALEGTNRSKIRTFKIPNTSQNTTGSQKLKYNDLNCKCLKWKAIIVDPITNCQTTTDWQFTSFL
ncbi:hypothetical protein A9Q86_11050 [Flavobacteriales bacterium 33_180_T64]|nr:hypothetical protein A9Q86_11050 [Flavobacteriales bacterium 33_180_T64]